MGLSSFDLFVDFFHRCGGKGSGGAFCCGGSKILVIPKNSFCCESFSFNIIVVYKVNISQTV